AEGTHDSHRAIRRFARSRRAETEESSGIRTGLRSTSWFTEIARDRSHYRRMLHRRSEFHVDVQHVAPLLRRLQAPDLVRAGEYVYHKLLSTKDSEVQLHEKPQVGRL
ncbi:MAG: hypothetical protein ACK56I_34650, partial [bacterium]